jgi:hypothetical protein
MPLSAPLAIQQVRCEGVKEVQRQCCSRPQQFTMKKPGKALSNYLLAEFTVTPGYVN